MNNLGLFYSDLGRYDEAMTMYTGALEARRGSGSNASQQRLASTTWWVVQQFENYEQAKRLYERALQSKEQTLGADHRTSAIGNWASSTASYRQ